MVQVTDLRRARRHLLDLRERLLCRAANPDGNPPITGDLADQAGATATREIVGLDVERVRVRVREVEAALRRVAGGAYGVCEGCGEEIRPKRLEAVPETRYCVACAEVLERREVARHGHDRRPAPYPADVEDE